MHPYPHVISSYLHKMIRIIRHIRTISISTLRNCCSWGTTCTRHPQYQQNGTFRFVILYVVDAFSPFGDSLFKMHFIEFIIATPNGRHGVPNHPQMDGLFNSLFQLTSKDISKPALFALCAGNLSMTDGFPSQRASNAEKAFKSWCHHAKCIALLKTLSTLDCFKHHKRCFHILNQFLDLV